MTLSFIKCSVYIGNKQKDVKRNKFKINIIIQGDKRRRIDDTDNSKIKNSFIKIQPMLSHVQDMQYPH